MFEILFRLNYHYCIALIGIKTSDYDIGLFCLTENEIAYPLLKYPFYALFGIKKYATNYHINLFWVFRFEIPYHDLEIPF